MEKHTDRERTENTEEKAEAVGERTEPMQERETGKRSIMDAGIAFLSGAVMLSLIFYLAGRFPGLNHIFLKGDYYIQHVLFIRMFFRHLFCGESMLYSFELSLGSPTWAVYAFEALSPLNFPIWFINDPDTAAYIVLLLKVALSAGSFCLLLGRRTDNGTVIKVAFSLLYALCGYTMNFYMNIQYMEALYILPILILLIERFVRSGRCKALILCYAYSFVTNFYAGYMLGVFSFIYYVVQMISEYGKDRGKYGNCILRYVFSVFCAVLLSAAVTFPTAVYIFRHMAGDATSFDGLDISIGSFLKGFFAGENQGLHNHYPMMFCGMGIMLLDILFFTDGKENAREKIKYAVLLVFLVLCSFVDPLYLMIHAFDAPDGSAFRFSYMFCFLLIYLGAVYYGRDRRRVGERKEVLRLQTLLCTAVLGGILAFAFFAMHGTASDPEDDRLTAEICGVFLLLYGIWFMKRRKAEISEWVLGGLMLLEVLFNGYFSITPDGTGYDRGQCFYRLWYDDAENAVAQVREAANAYGDGEFYRIYYERAFTNNMSMYFDYKGNGYFSSIESEPLRKALTGLGYAGSPRYLGESGSTPVMRMLLGQRYGVYGTDPKVSAESTLRMERYEETLPLGYMVSEEVLGYQSGEDVFANQNILVSAMTGEDICLYDSFSGNMYVETDNMILSYREDGYLAEVEDTSRGGWIRYVLTIPCGDTAYAYFSSPWGTAAENSMLIESQLSTRVLAMYNFLSMPYILTLRGNTDDVAEVMLIGWMGGTDQQYYDDMFFVYPRDGELYRVYECLAQGGMRDIRMGKEGIQGEISVSEDKNILFTSIPYDEDWEITVDGEAAETLALLDGAFLGAELTAGEHSLTFRYRDRNIAIGALISLAGLVLLLGWGIKGKYCNCSEHREGEHSESHIYSGEAKRSE